MRQGPGPPRARRPRPVLRGKTHKFASAAPAHSAWENAPCVKTRAPRARRPWLILFGKHTMREGPGPPRAAWENAHYARGKAAARAAALANSMRKHQCARWQGRRARGDLGSFCMGNTLFAKGQGRRARGGLGPFCAGNAQCAGAKPPRARGGLGPLRKCGTTRHARRPWPIPGRKMYSARGQGFRARGGFGTFCVRKHPMR